MRKIHTVMAVLVVTCIVALIGVALATGIGFSAGRIRQVFDALDTPTAIILGVASLVTLLCAWLIAAAIRSAGRQTGQANRQSERARIYQAILESVANGEERFGETATPPAATLFLIGGAPVVKEYRCLAHMLASGNASEDEASMQINRLMLAMRRDIGESTFGLDQENWSAWLQNPAPNKSSKKSNGATLAQRPEAVSLPLRL